MKSKAQIFLVTLISLIVIAISAIIGISLISSKEISFSNLISRGGGWFSSTISSLEYGLYKIKMQNIIPETEVTIPYFGEENLIPFFKAPFTITIYGEQFLPVVYEGYFGFKDLFYPIQWIFNWLVTKEKGEIKEVTINPVGPQEYYGRFMPSGYYAYYQDPGTNEITCAPLFEEIVKNFRFLNLVYAALQISDCIVSDKLMDNNLNSYTLLGDNASTADVVENFILDIYFDRVRYVDHLEIYSRNAYPGADIILLYWDPTLNDWRVLGVIQDVGQGWVYPTFGVNTDKIRLLTNYGPQVNLNVEISEVYVIGN